MFFQQQYAFDDKKKKCWILGIVQQQVFTGLANDFFLLVLYKNGVGALKTKLQGTARFQIYSECSVTNDATC